MAQGIPRCRDCERHAAGYPEGSGLKLRRPWATGSRRQSPEDDISERGISHRDPFGVFPVAGAKLQGSGYRRQGASHMLLALSNMIRADGTQKAVASRYPRNEFRG